jgi:hypothetical protein
MYRAPYRSEEVRGTQEPTRKSGVWGTRPLDGGVKPPLQGKAYRLKAVLPSASGVGS